MRLLGTDKPVADTIDFVVTWVDGNDASWRAQKDRYSRKVRGYGLSDDRFRDWDLMRYWFRAVESYAPWVRKVFFVTWGHLPPWLDVAHPKLRVVRHEEYIPSAYLPTFNSNVIELNLHRIEDLRERFVLFNDDMFLLKPTRPQDFFRRGLPCDEMVQNALAPTVKRNEFTITNFNNMGLINDHFSKRVVMRDLWKSFNPRYGLGNLRTLMLLMWPRFSGFYNPHTPVSHLKSTFETVWEEEPEILDAACRNKFRNKADVSHWLVRYWNLCTGRFAPRSTKFGVVYDMSHSVDKACACVRHHSKTSVCINDSVHEFDFPATRKCVRDAFEEILPTPCAFEADGGEVA